MAAAISAGRRPKMRPPMRQVGLELIEHRMRSLRSGAAARLRIASYPAYGSGFLPRAIARMERGGPKLSLQIMSSRDVYQSVLAGQAARREDGQGRRRCRDGHTTESTQTVGAGNLVLRIEAG